MYILVNRANNLGLLEMLAVKRNIIVSIQRDFTVHSSCSACPSLQCSICVTLHQGAATQLVHNDTIKV